MITVTQIGKQVYILNDRAGCCSNLVLGKEKALLFDVGCGADSIAGAVKEITDLPLLVIASHGHFDHIGGSWQFEKIYLSEKDRSILQEYDDILLNKWIKEMIPEQEEMIPFGADGWHNICKLDIPSFDLGEMYCQVVPLPGHTEGSVGIFIPALRLLLSGDALTPIMCLNFQNHLTKEVQMKTLQCVQQMDFDYYLTPHHDKCFPKALIDRMMKCIEHSYGKKHYAYRYPQPPYAEGYFYLDSVEEEAVGLIVAEMD